jgi:hypothetical protein
VEFNREINYKPQKNMTEAVDKHAQKSDLFKNKGL